MIVGEKIQFLILVLLNFQAAYGLCFKTKCSKWRRQCCAHSNWFGTLSSNIYRDCASKPAKPSANNQKVRLPFSDDIFICRGRIVVVLVLFLELKHGGQLHIWQDRKHVLGCYSLPVPDFAIENFVYLGQKKASSSSKHSGEEFFFSFYKP